METESHIDDWNQIPDGAYIIQDTYNEVYRIFSLNKKRWLKQVGWQAGQRPIPSGMREINFEPDCSYDQPWIWINCPCCSMKSCDCMGEIVNYGEHNAKMCNFCAAELYDSLCQTFLGRPAKDG